MHNLANQMLRALTTFEKRLAAVAYIAVAGLLIGDVLSRELFATSLLGAQKIAVLCAVTAAFAGFALVTHEGGHLRIGGLDHLVPQRYQAHHQRVGDALSAAIFITLAVAAFHYVSDSFGYGDPVPVLYIPVWPFQVILVYAFVASALRHLLFCLWPEVKPDPLETGH